MTNIDSLLTKAELPDSAYVSMPHELFSGNSMEEAQRRVLEFSKEQKVLNNPIVLKLDESLLNEGGDPWSVNSYRIGTMFVYTCSDRVEINYRGETRVIKSRTRAI
jgi:hypothetical protein